MRSVTVHVAKDGTTTTDFDGFQGASCLEAAERLRTLLAALGVQCDVTSVLPKPELEAGQAQSEQQRGRANIQQGGNR